MKTKIFVLIVIGIFLISSFSAIGFQTNNTIEEINICLFEHISLTQRQINDQIFLQCEIQGAPRTMNIPGKPMLPMYSQLITLPFGTKIKDIRFKTSTPHTMHIAEKIISAPQPVHGYSHLSEPDYIMDEEIYGSDTFFPQEQVTYFTGGGLNEHNQRATFLTIQYFPVTYNPQKNLLLYVDRIEISIESNHPETSMIPASSSYDLIIIAPEKFADDLLPLIDHKDAYAVNTILKTTEEIYQDYPGVDKPEQIKYFIKDAIESWNITYVLLVGGLKSLFFATSRDDLNQGSEDWYVPVRYTNLKESSGGDPGFLSDLYYADIYDSEGNFSSWDSDAKGERDGIFAKWRSGFQKDYIDLYPDVYVGRLACRNNLEVRIMVDKIINYEQQSFQESWFEDVIVVAGDTHNDSGTDYIEGEVMCDYILQHYMDEKHPIKLYASNRDINPEYVCSPENIIRELSNGCSYLFFTGHASPASWNTHWPGKLGWEDTPGGISVFDFPKINNDYRLPICVVEGCHSSQFNITFFATLFGKPYMWISGVGVPECWSWWLTRKIGGGSIATIGHTGLSYEDIGENGDLDGDGENLPDCLEVYCGYQNRQFFNTYHEGHRVVGQLWGGTIRKYLNTFPGMINQIDAKTMEQWVLLGDPSLPIGGYR